MHLYQCGVCSAIFEPDVDYNDEPDERTCVECGEGKGKIAYLGYKGALPYVQSDTLSVQGIKNPVNGQHYDSKSAYYQAVKDAGCVVVGNDAPTQTKRETRGDFNCREELKAAFEQHYKPQKKKRKHAN